MAPSSRAVRIVAAVGVLGLALAGCAVLVDVGSPAVRPASRAAMLGPSARVTLSPDGVPGADVDPFACDPDEDCADDPVPACDPDVEDCAEVTPAATPVPPRKPGPVKPTPPAPTLAALRAQVVKLTNADRARAGCKALAVDVNLTRAAQWKSADMSANHYFGHSDRDGRSFDARLRYFGVTHGNVGENIAYGQDTPAEVEAAWMASPGHRRNIADCGFHRIGVGIGGTSPIYWSVDFSS